MGPLRRLHEAAICERNGENLTQFAERIGITHQAANRWLKNHDRALYLALRQNRKRSELTPEEIRRRLHLLKDFHLGGKQYIDYGISKHALLMFRLRYAPDGVDEALEELT